MTNSVTAAAREAYRAGIVTLPVKADGSKRPDLTSWSEFQEQKPSDEELRNWFGRPRQGVGVVCGRISGNLEMLEFEGRAVEERVLASFHEAARAAGLGDALKRIEAGYRERTPSGGLHLLYRVEKPLGNTKLAQRPTTDEELKLDPHDKVRVLIETRGEGGFVVTAPSNGTVHPSGRPWVLESGGFGGIATVSAEERDALFNLARSFDAMPPRPAREPVDDHDGDRPGDRYNDEPDPEGRMEQLLVAHGWALVYRDGGGVRYLRRPGKGRGISATLGHFPGVFICFSTSTEFEAGHGYDAFGVFATLEHGRDFGAAAQALKRDGEGSAGSTETTLLSHDSLVSQAPWPDPLAAEAYHGLAGEFTRAVEPYTEADPAAVLTSFLGVAGAMVGSGVCARAGNRDHPARFFLLICGNTSSGRKDTAFAPVRETAEQVDSDFSIAGGLSSGEGVIYHVRDEVEKEVMVGKGDDRHPEIQIIDGGIDDKRLLVYESEFASVLKVMRRDGNSLSPILRQAWDGGDLRTLTKNSPTVATAPHVAIVALVTREELVRRIDETELANGFMNRFLMVAAKRQRLLPEGGNVPPEILLESATQLCRVIDWARRPRTLVRDPAAKEIWNEVYGPLSEDRPGLLGAATSRGAAQVLRLQVAYAVLDRSSVIQAEHVMAALAVWEYAMASARWIFGDALGDTVADGILSALRTREQMAKSEIYDLFSRHVARSRIEKALNLLLASERITRSTEPTGGRPREVFRAR